VGSVRFARAALRARNFDHTAALNAEWRGLMIAHDPVARDGTPSGHLPSKLRGAPRLSRTLQRRERRNRARHAILRKLDTMLAMPRG
jgi:hypothetical protein